MGEKMQAAGKDSPVHPDGVQQPAGAGESGGGAYPNPHTGHGKPDDGFMGHGGQSDIAYHGPGQLGDESIENANDDNSVTRHD